MIDIEAELFTLLVEQLTTQFEGIYVTNNNANTPTLFPAVAVVQESNTNYQKTVDACKENHAEVMFQIDIYTNDSSKKEVKARDIKMYISDLLLELGFNRTFCQNIPNAADPSIYRVTMRFKAVVGANGIIYSD